MIGLRSDKNDKNDDEEEEEKEEKSSFHLFFILSLKGIFISEPPQSKAPNYWRWFQRRLPEAGKTYFVQFIASFGLG